MALRKYIGPIIHVFIWSFFTYLFVEDNAVSLTYLYGDNMDIPLIVGTIINIILYYSNYLILFKLYRNKKLSVLKYVLILIFSFLVFTIVEIIIDLKFAQYYLPGQLIKLNFEDSLVVSMIHIVTIITSTANGIIKDWLKNEVIRNKLQKEKLSLELKYLKSQINPHFLFNTLNNLYSIALKNDDEETAKGLAKLSKLMRFMLDKSDKDIVRLDDEIDYLNSYIELQKLRFSDTDDLEINMSIDSQNKNFWLPPFLLIGFVENAFKYGVDYKKRSFINIRLQTVDQTLEFAISNSVLTNKNNDNSTKTGLINIKKRLELTYQQDYKLKIDSDDKIFSVNLKIKNLKT